MTTESMTTWTRIHPGYYVSEDERFEIVRTDAGWEWSDSGTGGSGVERTLRDAKTACWYSG